MGYSSALTCQLKKFTPDHTMTIVNETKHSNGYNLIYADQGDCFKFDFLVNFT